MIRGQTGGVEPLATRGKCHKEEGMKVSRILACLGFILGVVSLLPAQSLETVYYNDFEYTSGSEWSAVDYQWEIAEPVPDKR